MNRHVENPADKAKLIADLRAMGRKARAAARMLGLMPGAQKARALRAAAKAVRAAEAAILEANALDCAEAKAEGQTGAFVDRLMLDAKRIEAIAVSIEEVAALPDPVGAVMTEWTQPNGLRISRVRTPLGVIGVIFESRPNVTADAGALCLKAGNAVIRRAAFGTRHPCRDGRGACRGRRAGSGDPACAGARPRGRRPDADGARRRD
jgi:glutamate-5-semialdehyde dehydrogenase